MQILYFVNNQKRDKNIARMRNAMTSTSYQTLFLVVVFLSFGLDITPSQRSQVSEDTLCVQILKCH